MITPRHLVLTLITGESPEAQRRLTWGVPDRLYVGATSDWSVRAANVLDEHLELCFDGFRLRARAASGGADVRLRGERLEAAWRELPLPFELAFGGGRIAGCAVAADAGAPRPRARLAARSAPPGPRPAPEETQLFDLSVLRAVALAPHAIVSLGAAAGSAATEPCRVRSGAAAGTTPSPPLHGQPGRAKSPLPFEVVSGWALAMPIGGRGGREGRDARTRPLGTPRGCTLPREAAPTLVSSGAALSGSRSLAQTISDDGALRAYAQRLCAEQHSHGSSAPAAAGQRVRKTRGAVARRGVARIPALLPRLERERARLSAWLRRLTPRTRLLALPASCCVLALAWLLGGASSLAGASAAPDPPPAPGASTAAVSLATPTLDPAAVQPGMPNEPRATGDGQTDDVRKAESVFAQPSAAHDPPAERGDPIASAPPRQRPSLEQDAYRAAFGGNPSRAITLYEELARERGDEAFRRAARLLRANRVHKP